MMVDHPISEAVQDGIPVEKSEFRDVPVTHMDGVIGATARFIITAINAASHSYSVRLFTRKNSASGGIGFSVTPSRRSLTVREAA